uniref:Uncharacterized protein n=1 Tax=Rhizophora mucronata TaxID=61149 RepID=A0A2P2IWY6_RHIMU
MHATTNPKLRRAIHTEIKGPFSIGFPQHRFTTLKELPTLGINLILSCQSLSECSHRSMNF